MLTEFTKFEFKGSKKTIKNPCFFRGFIRCFTKNVVIRESNPTYFFCTVRPLQKGHW